MENRRLVAPVLAAVVAGLPAAPAQGKPNQPFSDETILKQCEATLDDVNAEIANALPELQAEASNLAALTGHSVYSPDVQLTPDGRDFEYFDACAIQAEKMRAVGGDAAPEDLAKCFGRALKYRMPDTMTVGRLPGLDLGNPPNRADACLDKLETALERRDKVRGWVNFVRNKTAEVLRARTEARAREITDSNRANRDATKERTGRLRKLQERGRR